MLKLSKMTDYAVVMLSYMAHHQGALLSASDIAQSINLPQPVVAKILKSLVREDIIISKRGICGGYRMDKTPDEVSLITIITAIDGPVALTACVDNADDACVSSHHCPLSGRWQFVNEVVENALGGIKLADMMRYDDEWLKIPNDENPPSVFMNQ